MKSLFVLMCFRPMTNYAKCQWKSKSAPKVSCTCISTPLHNFKCLEVMENFRACVFIRKIVRCGFGCHISLYFSFLYTIYVNIPFALFMFFLVQWVLLRLTLPLLWKLFIPIYMFSTVALTEGRLNVQYKVTVWHCYSFIFPDLSVVHFIKTIVLLVFFIHFY